MQSVRFESMVLRKTRRERRQGTGWKVVVVRGAVGGSRWMGSSRQAQRRVSVGGGPGWLAGGEEGGGCRWIAGSRSGMGEGLAMRSGRWMDREVAGVEHSSVGREARCCERE